MKPFPVVVDMKRGGTLQFNPTSCEFRFVSKTGSVTQGNLSVEVNQILPELPEEFSLDLFMDSLNKAYRNRYQERAKLEKAALTKLSYLQGLSLVRRASSHGERPVVYQKLLFPFEAHPQATDEASRKRVIRDQIAKVRRELDILDGLLKDE